MRTFIFTKGNKTEAVRAYDIQSAWDALEAIVGDTTGWEQAAEQG